MSREGILRFVRSALALCAMAVSIAGAAEDAPGRKTAGGLTVYLGVLPAAVVRGHPRGHAEVEMHDGVPRGRHAYHIISAVFDAATGERIEDAKVDARVTPLGLAPIARQLEPMTIAGTVTYGNYFTLNGGGIFRIDLSISHPSSASPVKVEFAYDHQTQ